MRDSHAVWEITLACNLGCGHCGSRAGKAREDELDTEEALDLVRQLAEVGIEEVSLIGGEAFLRPDWLAIARAIRESGMNCSMVTGGYGISGKLAARMAEAGIQQVSISIDGLEETHDKLRGRPGSWQACFQALRAVKEAGMAATCNTQINRLTAPELPSAYLLQREAGMESWQVQLTVPMGNAADRPEILLQPYELLVLFPLLARLKRRADADGIRFEPGNNVGYFGPLDRELSSENGQWRVWNGCHAGLSSLGIEADGTIKGCPSLPTSPYKGGNVRERSLVEIVTSAPELNFNAEGSIEHLWGFCRTCEHAELCRGGCSWMAHTLFGRRGNNPFCHHRAHTLSRRGLRERVRLISKAEGLPFDYGKFELIEEPVGGSSPGAFTADSIQWPDF